MYTDICIYVVNKDVELIDITLMTYALMGWAGRVGHVQLAGCVGYMHIYIYIYIYLFNII